MHDHELRLIIKTRLGAQIVPGMQKVVRYICGQCLHPYFGQDFAAHFLGCPAMSCTEGLKRHNLLARILAKYIELGGGAAIRELYTRVVQSRRRADIEAVLGLLEYLIDITVRNPTARSHLPHADRVLPDAEREKKEKYEDQALVLHAKVVPFAIDVYGALSEEAINFATTIAREAQAADPSAANLFNDMMNEMSVSLQRSNARMLARGIAKHQVQQQTVALPDRLGQWFSQMQPPPSPSPMEDD